jgi:hypothetical protein
MRKELVLTMLVLISSTGCTSMVDYIERSGRAEMSPDVTVEPGDGAQHDFLVTVASDFARLHAAMGRPSAYQEIYFSSSGLNVEVFTDGPKHDIAKWGMDTDGSITRRSLDAPRDTSDCRGREPFAIDEATLARLPALVEDAPRHTPDLDNAKLAMVSIHRTPGQFWRCSDVEIDVSFDSDCGEVYKNDDGENVYDCPTGDVVYDTTGRLLRSTIDPRGTPTSGPLGMLRSADHHDRAGRPGRRACAGAVSCGLRAAFVYAAFRT